jgi:acyl-coenzyme A thioesterase PaaI-like protein
MTEAAPLRHHELCFGCGQANLFGLHLDLHRSGQEEVSGRFFVKQDHQGAPGDAHDGVIAAALSEAMSLLAGELEPGLHATRLDLELLSAAPIGSFVTVRAWLEDRQEGALEIAAAAFGDAEHRLSALARAHGRFVGEGALRPPPPGDAGSGEGAI